MLREKINDAMKMAMREQNKIRLATLRLMNAAIKDRDIVNRGSGKDAVDDGEIQAILARMIKQREESAKLYDEGGRQELADNEREEIAIILDFLPRQLSDGEVEKAIAEAITKTKAESLRDMGKVMAWLKDRYIGQMDFAKASAFIKEQLK